MSSSFSQSRLLRAGAVLSVALHGVALLAQPLTPVTVSPGSVDRYQVIRGSCPTFSWGLVTGASEYEIEIFGIDEPNGEPTGTLVSNHRLPGAATSFTPGDDCLEVGVRYAWLLRATVAGEPSEWSEARFFEVSAVPRAEEVAAARELLARYLENEGGVLGDRTSGGPLDGNDESTSDRASSGAAEAEEKERARVASGGGSGAILNVAGTVTANLFRGNGTGLSSVWASNLSCSRCVSRFEVEADSLTGVEIANESIRSADLAPASVQSSEIAFGAVGGSELSTIRVVSVECNGHCGDSSLEEICGAGYEALFVDCDIIDSDSDTVPCGGNNRCFYNTVFEEAPLSSFCDDQSGFDAHVYCIRD